MADLIGNVWDTTNLVYKTDTQALTDFKTEYLSGIKLKDSDGNTLPDAVFITALKAAANWFELKTKIHLLPITLTDEQHDFNVDEYLQFCWINVYEYPVLEVTNIMAEYPTGQTIMIFPSTWVKLRAKAGQVQLVPTAGTLSQVLIGQSGNYLPLISGRLNHLPNMFLVSYIAGFDKSKIPDAVNDAIALRAAIHMMSTAGSMVIEPGIQSKSVSIDGLSQSTAAMVGQFGPYSGRINEYNQRLTDLMDTITMEYKGIRFVVL